MDAAEQEMEGAMARGAEARRSQLRTRELELAELQRCLASKDTALDELRATLASVRRGQDARMMELESMAAQRAAEVGGCSQPAGSTCCVLIA
jgi:hypothetical protein